MQGKAYQDLDEIQALIDKFLNKTLPLSEWTHAAHLTVGLYFVAKHGPVKAMDMMRDCIVAYNTTVGTVNSDSSGYHETITQFWIWLLTAYWQKVQDKDELVNACNSLLNSSFSDKDVFFKFYSRELLFSKVARRNFVPPDAAQLNIALIFE